MNNSTQEYLATDGSFGRNNGLNLYRLKSGLNQKTYSWTYTTPFNLTPGSYQFAVLATDNDGITTPQTIWAVAGFTAQVAGDAPPKALLTLPGTQPPRQSLDLTLAGTATDDLGVTEVRVALRDADTARYAKEGGGTQAGLHHRAGDARRAGATSTGWSLTLTLPTQGDWNVTAVAFDAAGQYDFSEHRRHGPLPELPRRRGAGVQPGAARADRGHRVLRRQDLRQRPRRGRPGDGQGRGRDHERGRTST